MHRAFRIKNLIIILLTQWLVWYAIYKRNESISGVSTSMSFWDMIWLGVVTALLAIGAYIINDVYDQEADKHNGIQRVKNKRSSILTYWLINLSGLLLSLNIAWHTSSFGLIWIYPVAVLILYLYSRLLKGTPLMGNFIVALFCALVPGILFLAERNMITAWKVNDANSWNVNKELMWMLILFSFLITMYREQVKDLEDTEGDKEAGYLTLPVVYGESRARALALFSGALTLISIVIYAAYHWTLAPLKVGTLAILVGCILSSIAILSNARSRSKYGISSKIIKYGMVTGLAYLLIGNL